MRFQKFPWIPNDEIVEYPNCIHWYLALTISYAIAFKKKNTFWGINVGAALTGLW